MSNPIAGTSSARKSASPRFRSEQLNLKKQPGHYWLERLHELTRTMFLSVTPAVSSDSERPFASMLPHFGCRAAEC